MKSELVNLKLEHCRQNDFPSSHCRYFDFGLFEIKEPEATQSLLSGSFASQSSPTNYRDLTRNSAWRAFVILVALK